MNRTKHMHKTPHKTAQNAQNNMHNTLTPLGGCVCCVQQIRVFGIVQMKAKERRAWLE